MRIVYFILFILSFDDCFSQDSSTQVFHLNKLPPEGVLLDKNWKFHTGDNTIWAMPDIDDSKWEDINPATNIHNLPQVQNAKICWLRLELQLDSSLVGKPHTLVVNQIGASEIYLNGKLVKRFGQVTSGSKQLQTFNPGDKPVTFQFMDGVQQVFAIRYAIDLNAPNLRTSRFNSPCFRMRLQPPDKALENYITTSFTSILIWYFQFGIYLLLTVIHLFFFIYYPARKVNLYFAIYTFCESIAFLHVGSDVFFHRMTQQFVSYVVFVITATVANIFLIISVYKLFNLATDIFLKSIVVFCILCVPFMFWPYEWSGHSILASFIISGLGTVRISMLSIKRKQAGAIIVLIGQLISILFFIIMAGGLFSSSFIISQISIMLAFLCPPVFISILLAREFAQTNISLKQQLERVEKLSQKTIAQEKEKQEILATQNELQIKAMVATQEQERKRISQDLHDDVGTKLSALNLFLSSLDEKAKCTNNSEIRSLTQSSRQFIKETMRDVRQLLLNLSPTVLEEFGYTTAVEGLVNKINETKQIHFDLIVFGIDHRLKKEYELALYRITQELINNVLKHAEAKHVSLQIGQRDGKIILMMEDDGKGFDVSAHKDGYGLSNLDARAKLMQGSMSIDSKPGNGTSVLVEIPYNHNGI